MPTTELVRADNLREAAHRSDPPFLVLMVPFEPVVQVFRGAMFDVRQEGAHGRWITFGRIRRHLAWGYGGCV